MMEGSVERLQSAPKGPKNLAQGFNPGLRAPMMRPESGARVGLHFRNGMTCESNRSNPIWCPFRARLTKTPHPGLKHWAKILSPFGAGPDRRPRPVLSDFSSSLPT
jgi:hypothetical protein